MSSAENEFNFDDRKYKIIDNQLNFQKTRKDMKYLKKSPNAYLESSFLYPMKENLRPDGGLDLVVQYFNDNSQTQWLQDVNEIGEEYPNTLTKFLGKPDKIDAEVDKWLTNVMVDVIHDIPIGAIVQLKDPSESIKPDRRQTILLVTAHNTDIKSVYPWMQNDIKIYRGKHIDLSVNLEDIGSSFDDLKYLQNGCKLRNGGEGDISVNQISVVLFEPSEYCIKIQYLQIKLFLKTQECDRYKNHCKQSAESTLSKMAVRLNRWLVPFFEDQPRKESFFIPSNIKKKEFEYLLKIKCGVDDNPEWKRTKRTEKSSLEYDQSISVFGRAAIVKNIRPKNGRPYILSNIDIHWTYSIERSMLKLECFVKKINT
eukprot:204102_1